MKCPKCNYNYCEIVSTFKEKGKDYSAGFGLLGFITLDPLGALLGCTNNRETNVNTYWKCKKCGHKFT